MPNRKTKCATCGDLYEIGDWPFCKGKGSHAHAKPTDAQSIKPVPYYEHKDRPGDVWHVNTGSPGEAPPKDSGYVLKEATTLGQIAARDRRETRHHNDRQQSIDAHRDPVRAESMRRSVERLQQLKKRDSRYADLINMAIADNQRPLRHDKPIEVMTQILHYDQSNRNAFRDRDGKIRRD